MIDPPSTSARSPAAAFAGPRLPGVPAPAWTRRATWALIALFAASVFAIALAFHPVGDYYTESDFYGGYAIGARAIQHGIVDPSRYPVVGPGYEFALAVLGALGLDLFLAGKLLSAACATATLALWSILLRRRVGAAAALAVTALFAANPVFVRYAYSATTDVPATFLASASIFVLLTRGSQRGMLAAGLFAALATLTRYNLFALVPAALVTLAWLEPSTVLPRRRAIAAYLMGFTVIVLPWALYSLFASASTSIPTRAGTCRTNTVSSRTPHPPRKPCSNCCARVRSNWRADRS